MAATAAPPTTTSSDTYDPYDAAMQATYNPTFSAFGQVQVAVWPCVLEKGVGKVPFDANLHDPARRVTAIDLAIIPVVSGRAPVERNMIAESREWASIVKPSLMALG